MRAPGGGGGVRERETMVLCHCKTLYFLLIRLEVYVAVEQPG